MKKRFIFGLSNYEKRKLETDAKALGLSYGGYVRSLINTGGYMKMKNGTENETKKECQTFESEDETLTICREKKNNATEKIAEETVEEQDECPCD